VLTGGVGVPGGRRFERHAGVGVVGVRLCWGVIQVRQIC
jgi:hypothetical protein